jgi:hypothetical protein
VRRRVFLHVGSPKTGTTFLQNVLWAQRPLAREQGLLLPMERFADHYLASLDVRGLAGAPQHPPRAVGMWQRMVEESLAFDGSVLISHELFAAASREQAARAVASFGGDTEVHVVLTARDLVRQISAEWQEHVKHRSTTPFPTFVRALRADTARTSWFWKVQSFSGVLERWGADLPPERVHVVTVPPSGSDPGILWGRFASLLGLNPDAYDLEPGRSNSSLSATGAELLRRVNVELGDRLPLPGPYPMTVKDVLAHRVLAARSGPSLRLAADDIAFARGESLAIVDRLGSLGFDVVGDLAELVPRVSPDASPADDAYRPRSSEELLQESIGTIADLLVVMSNRVASQRRAAEVVAAARERPVRFAALRAAETRPWLMGLRRAYGRLRSTARGR